jgi:hypothetical protein
VRALDIGGDKQVPHLDLPKRKPFLGVRGARLLRRRTCSIRNCARSIARRHWAGTVDHVPDDHRFMNSWPARTLRSDPRPNWTLRACRSAS